MFCKVFNIIVFLKTKFNTNAHTNDCWHVQHARLTDRTLRLAVAPLLSSEHRATRQLGARALAACCASMPHATLSFTVALIEQSMCDATSASLRCGAVQTTRAMLAALDARAACCVSLLVARVLAAMADESRRVRVRAAPCFAALVRLMPLAASQAAEQNAVDWLSSVQREQRATRRAFVAQLLDGARLAPPCTLSERIVNATLRSYQLAGVGWLAFLRRFGLHGALCDEMGLGKTLQTLAMLALDRAQHERAWQRERDRHHQQQQQQQQQRRDVPAIDNDDEVEWRELMGADIDIAETLFSGAVPPPPSLIVCPPTLQRHWVREAQQHTTALRAVTLDECGNSIQTFFARSNCALLVMSYDALRRNIGDIMLLFIFQFLNFNFSI